jgi:hypothetical protein
MHSDKRVTAFPEYKFRPIQYVLSIENKHIFTERERKNEGKKKIHFKYGHIK